MFRASIFAIVSLILFLTLKSAPAAERLSTMSDHFNGKTFFNPSGHGDGDKSFADMLKWWREPKEVWPDWIENDQLPPLPEKIAPGELHITFINHATFLLRTSDWSILTDPHFGERASPVSFAGPKRVRRPAYEMDQLPKIDFVLISHNHYDHLDLGTLRQLKNKFDPEIFVPLKVKTFLADQKIPNATDMDWWNSVGRQEISVTFVPAEHWSARTPWDRNKTLWGGYVLKWQGKQIFFAGDTGYADHFKKIRERLGAMDVALMPIGAYEPRWFMKAHHMNPAEAVQAHLDLQARRSIGMHFGTFQLTNEGYDQPRDHLLAAMSAKGLDAQVFIAPKFGQTLIFTR